MRKLVGFLVILAPIGVARAQAPATSNPHSPVKEESPGLLAAARVMPDAAMRTAAARVPKGTVKSGEIEKEGGKLIYSFDIAVPGQDGIQEVNVDAMTGKVVSVEHESSAAEAKEKAAEKLRDHDAKDKAPDHD